ncbi:MAG TPA: class I SAM-dependent methyltransferase [Candidatus Binataceae bacterium]|nr:class I SAM-dependent methyltransferase [Candidatus Binataceae bacterium]
MAIDQTALQKLVEKMLGDLGAAMGAALVIAGDRLGLYRALAGAGPIDSVELAHKTGCDERYVREWLAQQAASGYLDYQSASGRYLMTPEQELVFATEGSPAFVPGAFEIVSAVIRDEPKIREAFKSGRGVGWHEHDAGLFSGTERFFRPVYAAHLLTQWLPALEGVGEKLARGARVADVGCGHGVTTVLMAKAFPRSSFVGFDYHQPSLDRAAAAAHEAGVAGNLSFQQASAKDFPGKFELVACFDCLHDMGDPVGVAAHVLETLEKDGTWMIVEPFAHDRLADNLNPIGRFAYAASTMVCTPASRAQEVGLALGAQAGEKRIREVVTAGGFARFRRVAETPFNMVFEARP